MPANRIAGADGLRELCTALASEESLSFPGTEVARAQARVVHRAQRLEAVSARYYVDLAAEGFSFRPYDLGDRRLALDPGRFVLGDGAELYASDAEGPLAFQLGPEAADRVLREHGDGSLRLRFIFRPARSELREEMCLRNGGGRNVKLAAQVLATYLLRADGTSIAQAESEEYSDVLAQVVPVIDPTVVVARPTSSDRAAVPDNIARAAQAMARDFLPCYKDALNARPTLRGSLVAGGRLGTDGRLEGLAMEVSSLGSDELVSCVLGRLAKARFPNPPAALRLSIPLAFGPAGAPVDAAAPPASE